jgi:hypothetical protein
MHLSVRTKLLPDGGSETYSTRYPATAWTLCCHLGRGADFIPATMIRRNTRRGAALREFGNNRPNDDFDGVSLDMMVRNLHTRGSGAARCYSMRPWLGRLTIVTTRWF